MYVTKSRARSVCLLVDTEIKMPLTSWVPASCAAPGGWRRCSRTVSQTCPDMPDVRIKDGERRKEGDEVAKPPDVNGKRLKALTAAIGPQVEFIGMAYIVSSSAGLCSLPKMCLAIDNRENLKVAARTGLSLQLTCQSCFTGRHRHPGQQRPRAGSYNTARMTSGTVNVEKRCLRC